MIAQKHVTDEQKPVSRTIESIIRPIPYKYLTASGLNPRRHFNQEALEELAASITAQGILQNLVARERDDGTYEIAAGERRWRAVCLLIERGDLNADYKLPVRVTELTDRELVELAVAENSQRANVTPLEEADGFAKLIELGADVAEVADRFGRPERFVRQRIALHRLVPDARAALDEGRMTLATAQAFANAPRRIQQAALENSGRDFDGRISPYVLERLMRDDTFPIDKALFNRNLYDGDIVEDLFGTEPPRFADAQQARMLQMQAIENLADRYRNAGHEDVRIMPSVDWRPWSDPTVGRHTLIREEQMPSDDEIRAEIAEHWDLNGVDEEEIQAQIAQEREDIAERIQANEDALEAKGPIRIVHIENLLDVTTYAVTLKPKTVNEGEEKPAYSQPFLDGLQQVRTHALRQALLEAGDRSLLEAQFVLASISSYNQELRLSTPYDVTGPDTWLLERLATDLGNLAEYATTPEIKSLLEDVGTDRWPHMHLSRDPDLLNTLLAAPAGLLQGLVRVCLARAIEAPAKAGMGKAALYTSPQAVHLADLARLDPARQLAPRVTEADAKRLSAAQLKEILDGENDSGIGVEFPTGHLKKAELVKAVVALANDGGCVPSEWLLKVPA